MISGYDYDYDYIYIYIYIYICSGVPPGNSEVLPRRGPRAQGTPPGFTATQHGAPTGDPPPHGWVHKTTAAPPLLSPPERGTPARRVGNIVPCRAAMN